MGVSASDSTLDAMIDRAEAEVKSAARPNHVSRHIDIDVDLPAGRVALGGTAVWSRTLAGHLEGCREGFLFACTLGIRVDQLVKRYSFTNIPMLPVIQAVAAAYTEYCADASQRELEEYAEGRNLYLRPRYSPGYGDFSLECQRFFFEALQISKKIGVSLTDSLLMVPFKSITAVIGLSDDPARCHIGRCMSCNSKNCPFRKEA